MELWVQYTLDLRQNSEDGTLILGGWATRNVAYKVLPGDYDRNTRTAFSSHGVLTFSSHRKTLGSLLAGEIESANFACPVKQEDKSDFLYVYSIWDRGQRTFSGTKGVIITPGKRMALVLFVRTIPIHLPGSFKDHLRELKLLPAKRKRKRKRHDNSKTKPQPTP